MTTLTHGNSPPVDESSLSAPVLSTRRSFVLNSIVALPIAGAMPVASPRIASDLPRCDSELITLATEAAAAAEAWDAAVKALDDIDTAFDSQFPERPIGLKWNPMYARMKHVDPHRLGDTMWLRVLDAEALRTHKHYQWEFIGADDVEHGNLPCKKTAHLWIKAPQEHLDRRAAVVLQAWEEFETEIAQLRGGLGLDAAEEQSSLAADRVSELCEEAASRSAHTLEGMRAKARALLHGEWGGLYPPRNGATDLLNSLVRDLVGEDA